MSPNSFSLSSVILLMVVFLMQILFSLPLSTELMLRSCLWLGLIPDACRLPRPVSPAPPQLSGQLQCFSLPLCCFIASSHVSLPALQAGRGSNEVKVLCHLSHSPRSHLSPWHVKIFQCFSPITLPSFPSTPWLFWLHIHVSLAYLSLCSLSVWSLARALSSVLCSSFF